jgi:single-strand DNA-binding protein
MELKNVEIIKIGEIKTFPSGFSCVDFVIKTNEEYPQTLLLQANKDKAENLLKYNKVGQFVDVSINLRGRAWDNPQGETKYFNTIEAWKVVKSEIEQAADTIDKVLPPADVDDDDNELPF